MNIQTRRHQIINSPTKRPISYDLFLPASKKKYPLLVFVHGFKGFKDWGCWDLVAQYFATRGYGFCKFNFSHNGTSPDRPTEFSDLEAFGQNTYSKEFSDISTLLDHLEETLADTVDWNTLGLIGHSRGGAISIAWTAQDPRIKQLITWAAVDRLTYAWKTPQFIAEWKEQGVYYVQNSRTNQQMPLYYTLYEDYLANLERFDLQLAFPKIKTPMLIIHGDADPSVSVEAGKHLARELPEAQFELISGADHVFGGSHPYQQTSLPPHLEEVCHKSFQFLQKSS